MTNTTHAAVANRYGSIAAEIYDIDKPYGALPDTAFYRQRLKGVSGPILEPACGSGRNLVPLIEAGHELVGFDLSEEMLAQCRERAAAIGAAPDLSCQAYETFSYDRRFAAVIVPAGSFTLIGDFATAQAVLRRFFDHLEPGGLLMLDIQSLAMLANDAEDRRAWTAPSGDYLTLEGKRVRTDWVRQRAEYRIRYERWRDHRLVKAQMEPMVQRYWGLEEFRMALASAGFTDIEAFGSYDRSRRPRWHDLTFTFEAIRPA